MQNMYHYAIQELNSEEMHEKTIIIYIIQHLIAFCNTHAQLLHTTVCKSAAL